jgi:hypothetical protein
MKLRGEQLEGALNKALAPIWLIAGDEPLLVDEAVARIRQAARARGFDERQSFQAETGFDWRGWLAGFDSLSPVRQSPRGGIAPAHRQTRRGGWQDPGGLGIPSPPTTPCCW